MTPLTIQSKIFRVLILISLLINTSCLGFLDDLGENESNSPVLLKADVNGEVFKGYWDDTSLSRFSDGSFIFDIWVTDAEDLFDLANYVEVTFEIVGPDFNDLYSGKTFTENYVYTGYGPYNEMNYRAKFNKYSEISDDKKFTTNKEGGSGQFRIITLDTIAKKFSAEFSFTGIDKNGEKLTVTNGMLYDIEYY